MKELHSLLNTIDYVGIDLRQVNNTPEIHCADIVLRNRGVGALFVVRFKTYSIWRLKVAGVSVNISSLR